MALTSSATVKGGFWNTNGVGTLTGIAINNRRGLERRVAMSLGRLRTLGQAAREDMLTLLGVAPGGFSSVIYPFVEAVPELGGKRKVIQTELLGYNANAGVAAAISQRLLTSYNTRTTFGANPPANKDGNPLGTR